MLLRNPVFGFAGMLLAALLAAPAFAGDDVLGRSIRVAAPLEIPRVTDLEFAAKVRKRNRRAGTVENHDFLDLTPGLQPVTWPKPSDMRARIVTPEVRRTPVVGWIASSLYRSKKDNGWCLEVDPGEGEYVVFYRHNLK